MATEAAWLKRKDPQEGRTKTDLTLTGLLTEGVTPYMVRRKARFFLLSPAHRNGGSVRCWVVDGPKFSDSSAGKSIWPTTAGPFVSSKISIFPRHAHLLAHELCWVNARLGLKFLSAAIEYFGDVEIPKLVSCDFVNAPEFSGLGSPSTPGID